MLRLCVLVLAVLAVVRAEDWVDRVQKEPTGPFCFNGRLAPKLADDEEVGVRYMEAPLLSTIYGPIPGDLMHAYHVAILFETAAANYTLEYDAEFGLLSGVIPIVNTTTKDLRWNNAAHFCFTDGVLHGVDHWSVRYREVTTIKGAQFNDLFASYVYPNNSTQLYELMRVIDRSGKVLLDDSTCSNGVKNTIFYILDHYNSTQVPGCCSDLVTTSFSLHANAIEKVDVTNATSWDEVVSFYSEYAQMAAKGQTLSTRLHDLLKMERGHGFVYKDGVYYRLIGMHFPYATLSRVPVFPKQGAEEQEDNIMSLFIE